MRGCPSTRLGAGGDEEVHECLGAWANGRVATETRGYGGMGVWKFGYRGVEVSKLLKLWTLDSGPWTLFLEVL